MLYQPGTPYSPESDGVAERMNRTLMEKVRVILVDSGLPPGLWDWLIYTAVNLTNCSPPCPISGATRKSLDPITRRR
jgi:hypothetical protein